MKNIVKNSQFFGLFICLVGFLVSFAMGAQASNSAKPDFLLLTTSVSYTHLTLPTICSV